VVVVVLDAQVELVDRVGPAGEFLHGDRVFFDLPDFGVGPILEDVDNVGGLYLGLHLSLLLLGPPDGLALD
jgi:hypothetical protein